MSPLNSDLISSTPMMRWFLTPYNPNKKMSSLTHFFGHNDLPREKNKVKLSKKDVIKIEEG
ncbi:hypothetical protein WH14_04570 [Streptococcus dysgalactiae subsp. equisimilis]|nr:hypothetical protein WH14_04570 [Streptococcus dysgalactiae subsp. equisimilis]